MNGFFLAQFIATQYPDNVLKWGNWLCACSAFKLSTNLITALRSSTYTVEQKKQWIMEITKAYLFEDAQFLMDNMAKKVVDLSLLSDIYLHYKALTQLSCQLITAQPMARKRLKLLTEKLFSDKEVDVVQQVDTSLIGGFVFYANHYKIDMSIKNRLNQVCDRVCKK